MNKKLDQNHKRFQSIIKKSKQLYICYVRYKSFYMTNPLDDKWIDETLKLLYLKNLIEKYSKWTDGIDEVPRMIEKYHVLYKYFIFTLFYAFLIIIEVKVVNFGSALLAEYIYVCHLCNIVIRKEVDEELWEE